MSDTTSKPEVRKCSECGKEVPPEREEDFDICDECLDKLPAQTSWCSTSCRVTGKCDGAC